MERNRLKRRLRAAVAANVERLQPGVGYLVSARADALERTAAELEELIGALLDEFDDPGSAR